MASAASAPAHRGGPAYRAPAATSNAPPGTFLPGTKVQVGSVRVVIEKYLSEGGFAHVYVVRVPRDNNKYELAVLKRVAVPDKEHLASMRTEVETMKKLKGHKHVVLYMDSHASQLKGGGYEVFLLMEYCSGGGLIDFMNTRLQHRLTEPEILKIFGDVAEGVACMHYLKPPLLHRDLKVENVLIAKSAGAGGTPTYKLCDFGSTAPPRPAAKTAEEGRLIEEDVQKHTTMQYRSPEMIDVWRKQPIDEKADIWALGVLLYKLCYYTTPFEDVGQMAILNASYKYPSYPSFSERLKKLIAWTLKEDPRQRPNIYQVIAETSKMRGTPVPIKDIYQNRTQSEARRNESLPSTEPPTSPPAVGLQKVAPQVQVQAIPDIAPMRRGRPSAPSQQAPAAAKPTPSPARGDPFAALDSKNLSVRSGAVDELSKKFPSLDEFTIAHDKSGPFPFSTNGSKTTAEKVPKVLQQRVMDALADEVFAPKADVPKSSSTTQLQRPTSSSTKPALTVRAKPESLRPSDVPAAQAAANRAGVPYVTRGTGSSPPTSAVPKMPEISKRPIWRVPDSGRATSQPRASDEAQAAANSLKPSLPPLQRPALLDIHRSKSQTAQQSLSSRPSLESHRPSQDDLDDASLHRAKSTQLRSRPTSMYVTSELDYLRDQETSKKRPSLETRRSSRQASKDRESAVEEANIPSDMDYLRNNEDGGVLRKTSSRKSSGHKKRSSLPSISGAKNILAGRFGDAFKRFESSPGGNEEDASEAEPTTPQARDFEEPPRVLSPIAGSEAAHSRHSDNDSILDETEALPPHVRRELERRRLADEEDRVAQAAAEYRARVAAQGTGTAPSRANTIQQRVQSLLDEGRQSPIPRKTAEGYGRYTETREPAPPASAPRTTAAPPPLARKPLVAADGYSGNALPKTRQPIASPIGTGLTPSASAPPTAPSNPQLRTGAPRPSVPPKSQTLRTGGGRPTQWPPAADSGDRPVSRPKPTATSGGGLAALLAKDLEGVPDYPARGSSFESAAAEPKQSQWRDPSAAPTASYAANPAIDDLEADFSKRYPSLSGIEMVETEIGGGEGGRTIRVRDV